jgi:hypothetical protein
LGSAAPVRRPSMTAFVLPPQTGRERSFEFFRQLGAALRAMGIDEYGEIYALDDGGMPKYELRQLPGKPLPFWGLQDVTGIGLPQGLSKEDILALCRRQCRSDHFVLINEYKEIPEIFMLGASMSAENGQEMYHGYRIYKTQT